MLNLAKSRVDSTALTPAVSLKSVLKQGIADEEVDIKAERTFVFINLLFQMLYAWQCGIDRKGSLPFIHQ